MGKLKSESDTQDDLLVLGHSYLVSVGARAPNDPCPPLTETAKQRAIARLLATGWLDEDEDGVGITPKAAALVEAMARELRH